MVNTCFVWQRLPLYGRCVFSETNAIKRSSDIVGDQIKGQQMKFVYAPGSDPRYAK